MQITKGKVNRAQKVTIYGPEGIGKSTLASLFPNPVFIDVEQGTHQLDVARAPTPASFEMLRQIVADFGRDPQGFQTLVIDTADWAERLTIADVCSQNHIKSLGGAEDYGRSYNLLEEKWAKWLDSLTEICMGKGVNIVILAHAMMRKFEQPEEVGAFDRWEMKLQKKSGAVLKEWSDMILFLSYKTLVVSTDKSKTKKGTGGARVIRTTHHPCWDAKNRHGLQDEIALEEEHKTALPPELAAIFYAAPQQKKQEPTPAQAPKQEIKAEPAPSSTATPAGGPSLPANLLQLMEANNVTEAEIRQVVAKRGYYPIETPITNYTPEFVEGVLIAAWNKVYKAIQDMKEPQS